MSILIVQLRTQQMEFLDHVLHIMIGEISQVKLLHFHLLRQLQSKYPNVITYNATCVKSFLRQYYL